MTRQVKPFSFTSFPSFFGTFVKDVAKSFSSTRTFNGLHIPHVDRCIALLNMNELVLDEI